MSEPSPAGAAPGGAAPAAAAPAGGAPAGGARRPGAAGMRRGGRRAGESGTREAIAVAARVLFAERGYHGATIRAIAAAAGVDPALVHHFYGTKEALFAAAMRLPVIPSEALTAALAGATAGSAGPLGEAMVRAALGLWESDQVKDTFIGLLRSAVTSEQAALMLREFIADSILSTLAKVAGLAEPSRSRQAEFRVAMAATQMLGLALTRLVLALPPVAGASVEELAAAIGPSIERYLTGDLPIPDRRQRRRSTGRRGRIAESGPG